MADRRTAPREFVERLTRAFPDFVELRFNEQVGRWEFVFLSAAGRPVSQFLGWTKNPLTGSPVSPDPVTGLLPFRDLTPDAQEEIMATATKTFIGNRADGKGTWRRQAASARRHNRDVQRESARKRAEDFAYLIQQVDLRRPWVKYHPHTRRPVYSLSS